ncbi:MAG: prepilin-type N-terminal cleavage/methylation domain-containing protein [Planctomycetota bacterium]
MRLRPLSQGRAASRRSPRGFTLVELLVSISVIFLLIGVAVVAYRSATNAAEAAADRATVSGLRIAVGQFESEFGFVPPLVKDDGGPSGQAAIGLDPDRGRVLPLVFSASSSLDADVLRGDVPDRARFSLQSIPYYLLGALDAGVDGVDGLGFYEVRRDGSFAPSLDYVDQDGTTVEGSRRSQQRYEPFFDSSRGSVELFVDPSTRFSVTGNVLSRNRTPWRYELRDRAGVGIRYYRWLSDAERDYSGPLDTNGDGRLNIDEFLSDPQSYRQLGFQGASSGTGESAFYNVPELVLEGFVGGSDGNAFPIELRTATYAIVAAGPNELFGDEGGPANATTIEAIAADDELRRLYAEKLRLSESRLRTDADYRREAVALAREDNIVEVGS